METYTEDDLKQSGGNLERFQEDEELSSDGVGQLSLLLYPHIHGGLGVTCPGCLSSFLLLTYLVCYAHVYPILCKYICHT